MTAVVPLLLMMAVDDAIVEVDGRRDDGPDLMIGFQRSPSHEDENGLTIHGLIWNLI